MKGLFSQCKAGNTARKSSLDERQTGGISQDEAQLYSVEVELSSPVFSFGDSFEPEPWLVDFDSAQPFEYGPITAPNDLRVLLVLAANDVDDRLECRLTHQESSKAQYQALSYTWGDSNKTRQMLCNG
jgi:hypothetical protein